MGRWKITAFVEFDVDGADEAEAFEHFADAIEVASDVDNVNNCIVKHSDTTAIPFVVPPGAERWAAAATAIRFSDDKPNRVAMHDGSWWWTDGHAALRCEGDPPAGYHQIEDPFNGGRALPKKSRPTMWGPELTSSDNVKAHRADADSDVGIWAKLLKLVTDGAPEVRWMIGSPVEPMLALLGDTVVAIVMPFKVDRLPAP